MRVPLVIVAALAAASATAGAQCSDGTPPPCALARRAPAPRTVPAPEARARRFLLLPFRNVTRGPAQDWLVAGAPLMLGEALAQYRELAVVPDEQLTAARRRLRLPGDSVPDAAQLRRLADETDGWTAVTGNVFATGPRIRISVQALDVPTARVIVRAQSEVPADADVREAFNQLSVRLLEVAGVVGGTSDVAARTTQSVDAYRAYVEGVQLLQASAFKSAQVKLQEAVRLDSTFALAWQRLGMVAIGWNPQRIADPLSPAYRAIEKAATNASKLPDLQAQTVRAWHSFFRGQTRRARALADSLYDRHRDDLDLLELQIVLNMLDPTMDLSSPAPRLMSSWNRAVILARDLLDRDPGRRYMYATLAYMYGTAAGLWGGGTAGIRTEAGSLAAMILNASGITFYPVLRDSLIFLPDTAFFAIPEDERTRLRRRAADAGMEWVDRWLAVGDLDSDAHLWASRLSELRDDIPRALHEVMRADSLGIESGFENPVGRRLTLLIRAGAYARAAALADSLLTAGILPRPPLPNATLDRTRRSGAAALVLTRQWNRLVALGDAIGAANPASPACARIGDDLGSGGEFSLPLAIRKAVMDTVAFHFGEASAVPAFARCVERLAAEMVFDSTTQKRAGAGAALLAAADSLQRAGNADVAYRAARAAWTADTARREQVLARDWFVARSRSLAMPRHFELVSMTVAGDSTNIVFRRIDTEPLVIDEPGLATNWNVGVSTVSRGADTVIFNASLSHGAGPTAQGQTGGIPEFLRAASTPVARSIRNGVFQAGTTSALVPTDDGFRIVIRGTFTRELLRLRPPQAFGGGAPCIGVTEGLCTRSAVSIRYP